RIPMPRTSPSTTGADVRCSSLVRGSVAGRSATRARRTSASAGTSRSKGCPIAWGTRASPIGRLPSQQRGCVSDDVGVGALFRKGTKVHHLVGHRWILGSVAWFSDQTLPMIRDGHRKPLARYGATGARSLAACSAELHHQLGRDPCTVLPCIRACTDRQR